MKKFALFCCAGLFAIALFAPMSALAEEAKETNVFTQHGAVSWVELMTPDTEASVKFYTELFGWTTKKEAMSDGSEYITFSVAGKDVGGISPIPKDSPNIPPYWGMYITVTDVDATVKQAETLGAKTLVPPMDVPNVGRFAVLQDPQGAVISIITYVQPQQ